MSAPCATCPWRKSSRAGGADIPGFSIELMRRLRSCVGPGDDFRTIMACHYSPDGGEAPCRGYVAVEGHTNLSVRVAVMQGRIPYPAILQACEEIELWGSFEEMLEAYEQAAERGVG